MGYDPDPEPGIPGQVRTLQADGDEVWAYSELSQDEIPGVRHLFSLGEYYSDGTWTAAGDLQYTRIYLRKGITYSGVRIWQIEDAAADFRVGLYNQSSPLSQTGVPNSRVAQSNSASLDSADDGAFVDFNFISAYEVPTTGYYWIAGVASKNSVRVQSTPTQHDMACGFWPVYYEVGSGSTLPATAGTIEYRANGVAWLGLIPQ